MKLSHLIQPKKCFASAAWVGNLYVCPECGRSIACGANGQKYIYPPFNRYLPLIEKIPAQPEWYVKGDGWEELHTFMKNTLASIGDADVQDTDLDDQEVIDDE